MSNISPYPPADSSLMLPQTATGKKKTQSISNFPSGSKRNATLQPSYSEPPADQFDGIDSKRIIQAKQEKINELTSELSR